MCFILTILFTIATYVFYSKGLVVQSLMSGAIAFVALFFLIRKLIVNGPCLFGGKKDCDERTSTKH